MSGHEYFEDLAAGYALNALEPAEQQELTVHLSTCAACRRTLAELETVAAQLGSLVDTGLDTDELPSWSRIRSGIIPTAQVVSLETVRTAARARDTAWRSGRARWVGAAAAMLLFAAGVSTFGVNQGGSPRTQQQALVACDKAPGCHLVQLGDAASLIVTGTEVRMLPRRMPAAPPGKVYVLWQLPRDGAPTLVAVLSPTRDGQIGEQHELALSYASTAAFGVSLESADAIPSHPTQVVAVGTA